MDRKLAKRIREKLMQDRPTVERVRFRNDSIECYGQKPNTNEVGWWWAGYVSDVEVKGLECLN